MPYSDLELLQLQAEALYVHDANNRLLRVNESESDEPTPRFFLARSVVGNLWRVRYDLPQELATELERLAATEPVVSDLHQPPAHESKYKELLQQHAPVDDIESGPAYYLPEFDFPTNTVLVTTENANLLEAAFPYTMSHLDERSPVVVKVVDGESAAACYTVRTTAHVMEAGVDTLEAHRGHGYAVDIVRTWANAVRATGRLPLYSTSWSNTASQAVAKKLGAVLYGVDFNIT